MRRRRLPSPCEPLNRPPADAIGSRNLAKRLVPRLHAILCLLAPMSREGRLAAKLLAGARLRGLRGIDSGSQRDLAAVRRRASVDSVGRRATNRPRSSILPPQTRPPQVGSRPLSRCGRDGASRTAASLRAFPRRHGLARATTEIGPADLVSNAPEDPPPHRPAPN